MIIDFHTHTFPASISARVIAQLSDMGHVCSFYDPTAQELGSSMAKAGIDRAINLPVMTRPDQVVSLHDGLFRRLEEFVSLGIETFGGMHPDFPDFRAEIRRLKEHGIRGVKLHSAFQGTMIQDLRNKRIISALCEEGMITIIHAGWDVSFLDCNYVPVEGILEVMEEVRPDRLVLAHMGNWQEWDKVETYLAGSPAWFDTAYSLGPVARKPGQEHQMPYQQNLDPDRFVRLARKHGTDRILFGTDFPWANQEEYLGFLNSCGLTRQERENILGANAQKLLEG